MQTADFLLEIGSEEIPAGYIEPALATLRLRLVEFLKRGSIPHDPDRIDCFATPRRLAVRLAGLGLEQESSTQERLGPAVAAAFDSHGKATKAAEGFARSVGVGVEALQRKATDRGERLAATVQVGGRSTREIFLEDGFLRELLQLGFPKTMRWIPGDSFAYARPIRWIVALLGEEILPLQLAKLRAGRVSRGHRTLAAAGVEIQSPAVYEEALAAASVLVRPEDRRRKIASEAERLATEAGGRLHAAEDLLQEISHLVEHPFAVLGHFDAAIVDQLPPEVIITAMRSHQRYFSVEAEGGGLLPCFITFRDGGDRSVQNVQEGNERVLRARLDDARFYWDSDRGRSSEQKLEALGRIVWIEGFGTVREKCERVAKLSLRLAESLDLGCDPSVLERGALLSKSDLATEMIRDGKEFTKLQGVMGRYYALEAGEDPEVAALIEEHHRPRTAGDRLPDSEAAAVIAVADRVDTIVGCILAGFAPTGSTDPYGLRRAAFAVLRILAEREWSIDLRAFCQSAMEAFAMAGEAKLMAADKVADLFWGRLESELGELPPEIVRAVLSVSTLDPVENLRYARALAAFAGDAAFAALLEGARRCRNILVKEGRLPEEAEEPQRRAILLREAAAERFRRWLADEGLAFDATALVEAAERGLHAAVVAALPRLDSAASDGRPSEIYATLAALGPDIARYFDEVLVNAEAAKLRANRLGFLEDIHYLFTRFADLSRIAAR
jgi:glycyl-tRNA synthetase beta chain